ncbi:dethiobiotin synthase [Methanococcus vannielii SB]|uniref:ATP-dependent dethiobiotin synthetase BioD n=1 Tax=Methanococcus vannielii (strain ATCC 35089 / DSM 1224 / JCM 13029 / OCM 148 / SB) TaxID=406327 RepID=BIOD_METVS|nr:dethiobiotin synthase [Methanococcus vannielii]A6UQL8.1 RecName: Full=ATP-dependent dethiobiotin synthetase BioD; AltName: Full=DTB synthetase; Short=DTBS; AltName: Full=Dethiobiotin synthase [Methanococcus vannielii SB]ABR54790.1 dethiobiotin synthase [Methanococcus vannielii SB]
MIFVTGTDTGIGKTYVSAILGKILKEKGINVGYMKPVESGGIEDTAYVRSELGLNNSFEELNPVNLKKPLSPNISAKIEEKEIDILKIKAAFEKLKEEYEFLIVEGAGGVAVPIKKDFLIADLIKYLDLTCIVVSRPNLGTINHTILTVDFLRKKGITVLGVIINCITDVSKVPYYEETFKSIEEFGNVEIIGIVNDKKDFYIDLKKLNLP